MNLFCSHLTATLTLLTLGRIKVDHASAFDFVEFASAQHSLSSLTLYSLTRSFPFSVFTFPFSLYFPFFMVRPKSKIRFTVPPQQLAPLGP